MVHVDPEVLAGLALEGGDDGDPADVDARQHVAACARCAAEVDDLRRVAQLARTGEVDLGAAGWQRPPADLWSRIDTELDAEPDTELDAESYAESGAEPDADLGSEPGAGVDTEHDVAWAADVLTRSGQRRAAGRARRTTVAWLAAACAAGVLAGVGGAWSFWREPASGRTTTVASVPLDSLETRQQGGRAVLESVAGKLDLRVDSTSLDARSGFLEVWLLNADGKRMVSLGMLQQPDSTFPVSQEMLDRGYVIVDISREAFDDRPQHSGDSLLRGRLSV